MDLISAVSGTTVAAITKGQQAVIVDFLARHVVSRVALKKDTDTRISFDRNQDKFILGSWTDGIDCLELASTSKLWHSNYSGYTHANLIDGSNELYVAGLKDDPNGCRILAVEGGLQVRYLKSCGNLLGKGSLRIGLDSIRKVLLIFDSNWNLLGSPEWKCFGLWSFACDDSGIIIVSGPSGYAGSFIANINAAVAEVRPHEYFLRIESVCWNRKRGAFYAVVSEFEGRAERALLKLDHMLRSFEVVLKFPLASREVICDDRYLVAESGLVFDLDLQQELDPIDWNIVLRE